MNIFKKPLLVSTALLLGMQETWSLPLGGQETQEDGQKYPPVSKKELPEIEKKFIKSIAISLLRWYYIKVAERVLEKTFQKNIDSTGVWW